MFNILADDRKNPYGIRHFVADEEKDIPNIGTNSLSAGSTVFVIENSKTYMLNSSKLWIPIKANSGGGGGGGGDNSYDGGGVIPGIPPSYDGGNVQN